MRCAGVTRTSGQRPAERTATAALLLRRILKQSHLCCRANNDANHTFQNRSSEGCHLLPIPTTLHTVQRCCVPVRAPPQQISVS